MDRRLSAVPRGVRWALGAALVVQLAFAALQPPPSGKAEALPVLPSAPVLRITSLRLEVIHVHLVAPPPAND